MDALGPARLGPLRDGEPLGRRRWARTRTATSSRPTGRPTASRRATSTRPSGSSTHVTWPAVPGTGGIAPGDSAIYGNTANPNSYLNTARRVLAKTQPLYGGALKCNFLRAPSAPQMFFASEQIVDELAHAMNMDPVAFRRQNIDGTTRAGARWLAVLDAATAGGRLAAEGRRTRSSRPATSAPAAASASAPSPSSQVGIVADVQVNMKSGKIVAKHLYIAQNNGITIGPQLVANQMSGAAIQGLSRAMWEQPPVEQPADHEPRLGHLPDPPLLGDPEGDARQRPPRPVRHGQPRPLRRADSTSTSARATPTPSTTAGCSPVPVSPRPPRSARR